MDNEQRDSEPLAVLQRDPDRDDHTVAALFAGEIPAVAGYVVVTDDPPSLQQNGGSYFLIDRGTARATSAVCVQPWLFYKQAHRVMIEIDERRKQLQRDVRALRRQLKEAGLKQVRSS